MRYGYIRVSTQGQARNGNSLQDQRAKLIAAGVPEGNIAVDVFTGTKLDRPGFDELMKRLGAGDELVVCKLDRFARTAAEGSLLVRDLLSRDVAIRILNMGTLDNTPIGKMSVTMFLAFAEFERDQIVERCQAGKSIARQRQGYQEGLPRKQYDTARFDRIARRVSAGEISQIAASEDMGMSPTTFSRRYREWLAAAV